MVICIALYDQTVQIGSIDHSAARSVHSVEHIVLHDAASLDVKHKPAAQVEYVVLDIQFAHAALAQHITHNR